ncbi:MAG: type II secretion system F family protein [Chloroflexota bacterium]
MTDTLTYFNIPFFLVYILPFVGAGALGWAGYLLGQRFAPDFSRRTKISRLENFAGGKISLDKKANSAPVGSFEHKVRIAFSRFGVNAAGREEYYLNVGRLAAGAALSLTLMVIGLPFLTSLIGFIAGRIFVNGWITRSWNKTRTEMEAELPSLLMRLNATLQTAQNVPSALEIVAKTLRADGPLRAWTLETANRMHAEGHGAIETIRQSAAGMSMSLSIVAELIGRVWTTGGEGYSRAFGTAADNLESVLDARVLARSKGGSAQGTVNILTVMTFGMIAFMTRNPAMAAIVNTPLVQVLYAVVALVIVYGHSQVSDIIDNAV